MRLHCFPKTILNHSIGKKIPPRFPSFEINESVRAFCQTRYDSSIADLPIYSSLLILHNSFFFTLMRGSILGRIMGRIKLTIKTIISLPWKGEGVSNPLTFFFNGVLDAMVLAGILY